MNLEGTKHEKAVLVVIAYIIGFTSGFIAFGISNYLGSNVATIPNEISPSTVPPPDFPLPTSNPPNTEATETTTVNDMVVYQGGKLYATIGAESFVLSLHNEIMPADNVEGFSTQGIHYYLPAYSVSQDGRFVHFCEQQTTEPRCTNFVFDVTENIIQPVSYNGERLIVDNGVAATAKFNGAMFSIGEYTSITAETPWKVVSAQ